MGEVSKIAAARLLDPTNAALDGQARVNAEIFTAVEILGRKLERAESERDRLARRLALFESAATVDEKTGKLYLPVVANQDAPAQKHHTVPRWMVATTLMSSAVALFALGLVLFREPAPALTKEQLAALDSLSGMQFTQLTPENKGWRSLATEPQQSAPVTAAGEAPQQPAPAQASAAPAAPQPDTSIAQTTAPATPAPPAPAAQLPDSAELAKMEQAAEAPKPAEAPAPALNIAATPVPSTEPPPLPGTSSAVTAAVDPQKVLIPGEDNIPEKTVKAAQADDNGPDKNKTDDKTAGSSVVPKSGSAGGIVPDAFTDKKLVTLQKRAYQGIPEAQHDLATLYAAGSVIPQNYRRAAFWFTKAADGGVANAHYNMGVIYHQGLGVPVDLAKALGWYEKAAELGHPEAMYNLGIAYIEGVGTKVDIDKGVSYFKRASKAGVAQAAYNLGVLYESNFIGPIDLKKATEWYAVAAKQGHEQARDALARLQQAGGSTEALAKDTGDQARTLADKVEPSAGGDEEMGEGDSSPVSENKKASDGPKTLLGDIQRILIKQGLLPGKADGVLSPQTEDVIRSIQKKFGLTEDGQPSQELLEKLLQAPPAANKAFP
jgi:TPR repeat protein